MSDTFSVRLPPEQMRFIEKMAQESGKSRSKIISDALAVMIENYEYVTRLVEDADEDIKAGRVVSHEEVVKRSQTIIDRAFANWFD